MKQMITEVHRCRDMQREHILNTARSETEGDIRISMEGEQFRVDVYHGDRLVEAFTAPSLQQSISKGRAIVWRECPYVWCVSVTLRIANLQSACKVSGQEWERFPDRIETMIAGDMAHALADALLNIGNTTGNRVAR